jgi:hypothetical protein
MPLCISSIADDIADEASPMPLRKLSGIVPNSIAAANSIVPNSIAPNSTAAADASHVNTAAINLTTVEVKPKTFMPILMFCVLWKKLMLFKSRLLQILDDVCQLWEIPFIKWILPGIGKNSKGTAMNL